MVDRLTTAENIRVVCNLQCLLTNANVYRRHEQKKLMSSDKHTREANLFANYHIG